jgi:hypothetical protein
MKNYKAVTTILVFGALIIPGLTLANSAYYTQGGFYEETPVQSVGAPITTTSNTSSNTMIDPADSLPTGNLLGIKIKTKAERQAEQDAQNAAKARAAEEASVARNQDGSLAYGYTNGSGAQYSSGARYTDARSSSTRSFGNNSNNLAAAGSLFGSNFLPNTIGEWLLALLMIAILVGIIRALTEKMNSNRIHAHANMGH